MAIVGVVTNKGLTESVRASSSKGWAIHPTRFGISADSGELRPTREDTKLIWYEAPISDQTVVSENTIQFVCTIPPQVIETDQHINEIYLFGENSEDQSEFLLAVGQPTETITYFKDGTITLRMHVTLANVQASQVFEIKYAGHRSIEDHNTSEDAHQELFGALSDQIKSLGDAILVDNQVSSGGAIYIDRKAGTAQIDDAKFYHNGILKRVPGASFVIPLSGKISVGIWTGKNDQDEETLVWGTRYHPAGDAYHEVHIIQDGFLMTLTEGVIKEEPVHSSVVRYDREANGSYVVHGMNVGIAQTGDDHYIVQIGAGKAHIDGSEVDLPRITERTYNFDPDTERVVAELHRFLPDEKGQMGVVVDNQPIATQKPVKVTYSKRSTLGIQRGNGTSAGGSDFLTENLLTVHSVKYGTTTFLEGRDYQIRGGLLDWSPMGAEPPPGSRYTVDFEYIQEITLPEDQVLESGFTFEGAIIGSNFHVEYEALLPRKDLIVLERDGSLSRIKGKGDTRALTAPKAPAGTLALAELGQHWTSGIDPAVENTGVVAVRADDLNAMRDNISNLFDMVAEERIARMASGDDPRPKRGIFVDAFVDDSQRDGGAIQTAMVNAEAGELTLSSDVHTMDTKDISKADAPNGIAMLPYSLRTVLEQNFSTSSMKVNPYSAFDPIPPTIKLSPALDNWTVSNNLRTTITQTRTRREMVRASTFRSRFNSNASSITRTTGSTVRQNTLTRNNELPYLRELRVSFEIAGFKPGEKVTDIRFGSTDVTPSLDSFGLPPLDTTLLVGDNSDLDTRPLYDGASEAITSWVRQSFHANGPRPNELTPWSLKGGRVNYGANSGTYVTLTSRDTFDNFDTTVRVRGTNGDDDWIGLVLASITTNGQTHTLSAVRATRDGKLAWRLLVNAGQTGAISLFEEQNRFASVDKKGVWSTFPEGTTIRVIRKGTSFKVLTSKMGELLLDESSAYTFDIDDHEALKVFKSPCAWGFVSYSQPCSFEVLSHTNAGNIG
ncbi:DUF4815 domain-containing protein [Pseudoalteromonas umbrosa]|uniref:DUF4815 domain-containing protein n=1 Tax=Pseudoalteromonas umbrosa TaxID=3048489 RepID=UPI0024C3BDC7|nr:DUF4815 domain-containing protein [Pseudoalteromonas sp. B95]MDK1290227.1 DUF4815 domain-containing protein [Pseudoalteromonas sp. B95]